MPAPLPDISKNPRWQQTARHRDYRAAKSGAAIPASRRESRVSHCSAHLFSYPQSCPIITQRQDRAHQGICMTRTSLQRTVAALLGGFAFAAAGAHAQGLVTTQKLSAGLANQLVGDFCRGMRREKLCRDRGRRRSRRCSRGRDARRRRTDPHARQRVLHGRNRQPCLPSSRNVDSTRAVAERMAKNRADFVAAKSVAECHLRTSAGRPFNAGGNIIGALRFLRRAGRSNSTRYAPAPRLPRSLIV